MLNHIIIHGRLTKDPELKQTSNGTKVTTISVACDRDYSSGEEKQVDFIDCVAWRSTAEFICRNFSKGMPILIQGRLQIRKYQDKDGNNRSAAEINVASAHFAGGKRDSSTAPTSQADAFADIGDDDDDELPWK